MKITAFHVAGWIGIAVAAVTILADTGSEPEAAPAPAPVVVPAKPEWLPAAGNLWPGTRLYFGQHDKIYRGQIAKFVDTPSGEAAVLVNGGQVELMLRKDIAIRDFWVRPD